MKNWTIAKRIAVGFTLLSLITFAVGITGFISLRGIGGDAVTLIDEDMPGSLIMGQVKDNLSRAYANVERYLRSTEGPGKAESLSIYNDLASSNTSLYEQLEKTFNTQKERDDYQNLLRIRKDYAQTISQLFELEKAGDIEATYRYMDESFVPQYRAYRDAIDGLLKQNRESATQMGADIRKSVTTGTWIIALSLISALVFAITIAWIISSGTNKVLNRAINSIDEGSSQVAAASSQVSAASNMLAEGASEQAASLEETSSSLEEMSSMTARNAASAQEAKALADVMHQAADESTEKMKDMQQAMDAIKESSAGISQIIKTIDEIAFQTNILALNAAVEAARAGEAGAGFAVVAEEVRNLAQRSANSAKETSAKIEGAIRNSERGVTISAKVAESLGTIVSKARQMNQLVAEIATASQEQDKGIGQLTIAVQQMDKVTQSNASNAEETASASEELNAHADTLKETVNELVSLVRENARASKESPRQGAFVQASAPMSHTAKRPASRQPQGEKRFLSAPRSGPDKA
jgi:methyl-accepting chemotaxis protein